MIVTKKRTVNIYNRFPFGQCSFRRLYVVVSTNHLLVI